MSDNNLSSDQIQLDINSYLTALINSISKIRFFNDVSGNSKVTKLLVNEVVKIRTTFNSKDNLEIIDSQILPVLLQVLNTAPPAY